MTPAVRSPYCAGSAPVSSFPLPNRCVQRLAEAGDGFGKEHAVDAVLQIGMIAAHVQLTIRVLHHSGRLQHHLIQRRVFARGKLLMSCASKW